MHNIYIYISQLYNLKDVFHGKFQTLACATNHQVFKPCAGHVSPVNPTHVESVGRILRKQKAITTCQYLKNGNYKRGLKFNN